MSAPSAGGGRKRLAKTLTLTDTWAIATGAMFSSGFFLLPGVATAQTGTSVVLAYAVAGLLVIPAMLSQIELSTAMPRAGGTYFFIDRALGPMAGTVGGAGAWITLVLKSGFALVGLGAVLTLLLNLPTVAIAAGFGAAFTALNMRGADHSSSIQRILVAVLVGTMSIFIVDGMVHAWGNPAEVAASAWGTDPFFSNGFGGFIATVGLVSVSYAGLTKVASVAEEVRNPDRNLPWGMILALVTATVLYAAGVTVLLMVLPAATLHTDLSPVASAAAVVFDGPLASAGRWIVVAAAVAAFVSTANAGVLAAARYPLAMARDGLAPKAFAAISDSGVPRIGVAVTGVAIIASVLVLDVSSLAKLASAFQLLLFGLICFCVIVMREARIEAYRPGFKSPLYPGMQIAGMIVAVALISAMGLKPVAFTFTVVVLSIAAYLVFARKNIERTGTILHVFRRLGRGATPYVERELGALHAERALEDGDRCADMVGHAVVEPGSPVAALNGKRLREAVLPDHVLVVLVARGGDVFVPTGDDVLREGDRLTIVGRPEALAQIGDAIEAVPTSDPKPAVAGPKSDADSETGPPDDTSGTLEPFPA
ncbi:MAG: APA family basic amino acid/polyamine antiporter [Flavobacteriales bacterium]